MGLNLSGLMTRLPLTGSTGATLAPLATRRIVLTGFMGSGKTTVGRMLAERLGWPFVDLDSEIERADSRTVATIFAESGEAYFRALESDALRNTLEQSQLVVALGGGALDTEANRKALDASAHTCTVFLTAPFDMLYDRCRRQAEAAAGSVLPLRPLLGDRAAAEARLARRDPVYRHAARHTLDTAGQTPQQSVDALLELLRSTA